jgi:hypothetical protein
MIRNKKLLIGYKLFFGLLGFSAIVTEVATIAERGQFDAANFFSYFTIQTNILVFLTLILSAIAVAMNKNGKLDIVRGAVTVYIFLVGVAFSVLLARIEGITFTAVPWDNLILHYIMPLAMLIDFLFDRPKRKLSFKWSLLWLIVPVAYLAYSLIRGAITGWYPYPFLCPDIHGYEGIAVVAAGLLGLTLILIGAVTKLSGKRKFV